MGSVAVLPGIAAGRCADVALHLPPPRPDRHRRSDQRPTQASYLGGITGSSGLRLRQHLGRDKVGAGTSAARCSASLDRASTDRTQGGPCTATVAAEAPSSTRSVRTCRTRPPRACPRAVTNREVSGQGQAIPPRRTARLHAPGVAELDGELALACHLVQHDVPGQPAVGGAQPDELDGPHLDVANLGAGGHGGLPPSPSTAIVLGLLLASGPSECRAACSSAWRPSAPVLSVLLG
jgi:hypothetical protein